jgi:hypothetical protein
VQTESSYVHRSEDVCYWVQLSLPLLSKAMAFCENCAKRHSFACRTSAASDRRGLYHDGHSPSFQRHDSHTLFSRAMRLSIKRCNTARLRPIFGRIDKILTDSWEEFASTAKDSTQL